MSENVEINKTIKIGSSVIGSDTDEMHITDNFILLGSTRIRFSDIKDVKETKSKERDHIAYSIILSNIISSLILGLTLTQNIFILLGFSIIGFCTGYVIIKLLKQDVPINISMVTEETEYAFGICNLFDAGEFFVTIDEKTDINLSHENFLISEKVESIEDS